MNIEIQNLHIIIIITAIIKNVAGKSTTNHISSFTGYNSGIKRGKINSEEERNSIRNNCLNSRKGAGRKETGSIVFGQAVTSKSTPHLILKYIIFTSIQSSLIVVKSRNGNISIVPHKSFRPVSSNTGNSIFARWCIVTIFNISSCRSTLTRSRLQINIVNSKRIVYKEGYFRRKFGIDFRTERVLVLFKILLKISSKFISSINHNSHVIAVLTSIVFDASDVGVSHRNRRDILNSILNETLHPIRHEGSIDRRTLISLESHLKSDITMTLRNWFTIVAISFVLKESGFS